jgi:hypothetical protein
MFPHWIEMVSTEGQLTFRSDEAEGLYDAMSQIIWPSYGNSLEEGGGGSAEDGTSDVFALCLDSRVHLLFVMQHLAKGFAEEKQSFNEEMRTMFTRPLHRADDEGLHANIESLLCHLTRSFSPYLGDRVVVFFKIEDCNGHPHRQVRMLFPSDMEATGVLHRFPTLPGIYHQIVVARGISLKVLHLLSTAVSSQGNQFEDRCEECKEDCYSFEAMRSHPYVTRACHKGPEWLLCSPPMSPEPVLKRSGGQDERLKSERGVTGCSMPRLDQSFDCNASLIPMAGFSFEDESGRKTAYRMCCYVCEDVDRDVFMGGASPVLVGNEEAICRSKTLPDSTVTGQDWSQHYRRWARVVAKKGDGAYWVCLQLAKPDSPFSFEGKHGCKEEVHDPM